MNKARLLNLIFAYATADWRVGYQRGRISAGDPNIATCRDYENEALEQRSRLRAQIVKMLGGDDANERDD